MSKLNVEKAAKAVERLLATGQQQQLVRMMARLHASDKADLLEELEPEIRDQLFALLGTEEAAEVLDEVEDEIAEEITDGLSDNRLAEIIDAMPPDEGAEQMRDLEDDVAARVLELMPPEESAELRSLLSYEEDSAGAMMTPDLVTVPPAMTVGQVLEFLRRGETPEEVFYLYVTDTLGKLLGVVDFRKLVTAALETPVSDLMTTDIIKVATDVDREEVSRLASKYNLYAIPVLDETGVLVGRITVDDLLEVMEEEHEEDVLKMAGMSLTETLTLTSIQTATSRIPYLLVSLGDAIISSILVGVVANKLGHRDPLMFAMFVPAIAALGNASGAQTMTLIIRALIEKEASRSLLRRAFLKQMAAATLLGVIFGLTLGFVALMWTSDNTVALSVGVGMAAAIIVSVCTGILVPVSLTRAGVDPALAANPLLSTLNDISGIAVYLGVAYFITHLM